MADKPVARQSKQENEAIHYVHCCLIIRGCINTPRSVVASYVGGTVNPVGDVQKRSVVEVHGVEFTLHYLLEYVN